jgi:hypothetical protein
VDASITSKKQLNLTLDECRRLAFGPREFLGLDFPRRIHGQDTFFGQPGKQHPDRGHVLFDRGRRGLAFEDFDICGDGDGLNVFEVLISSAFTPGEKLLDRPVIGGPRVSVADRDRKKLEELFPG